MLPDSGRMFTRFNGGYLALELFHGHNYVEQPDASDRACLALSGRGSTTTWLRSRWLLLI